MTLHLFIENLEGNGVQFDGTLEEILIDEEFLKELAVFGKENNNLKIFEYYFGITDRNFCYKHHFAKKSPVQRIYEIVKKDIEEGKYKNYDKKCRELDNSFLSWLE